MMHKTSMRIASILLLTAFLHGIIALSGVIPLVDFRLLDMVSHWKHKEPTKPFPSTVIVEIDEKSLAQLGQWPWPRVISAKVVDEILKAHPAALGIDVLFPEADRTSPLQIETFYEQMFGINAHLEGIPNALKDHDAFLANALVNGQSILPVFASSEKIDKMNKICSFSDLTKAPDAMRLHHTHSLLCNIPSLQNAAKGIGFINASVDGDGVFRRQLLALNHQGNILPSLALAMLERLDEHAGFTLSKSYSTLTFSFLDKNITTDAHAGVINYLYSKKSFQHISASDVFLGKVSPTFFSGKLVLFGATATGLFDQYVTPRGEIMPGIYIHASLLENMLSGGILYQHESSKTIAFGFSFVLGLFLFWLVSKKHYLLAWGVYLVTCISSLALTWVFLSFSSYPSLGYFIVPFSFLFFIISLFFAVLHYVERKHFLEDLGEAHSATIDSMTMVAESRDVETGTHIVRTKEYVKLLAEHLLHNGHFKKRLNAHVIDLMYRAAPLHDIGKVGIPDAILQKKGPLDDQEMQVMRQHATIGASIIENAINSYNKTNEFLTIAANIAHTHHEKWDGTGYPKGLKGEEIPLEGRLMALADVYDALISKRCYKEAMDFESAEKIIIEGKGSHFDPIIVDAFVTLKEQFHEIALKHSEQS